MVASLRGEERYDKSKVLGEGTVSVVYKAIDKTKQDDEKDYVVAVKKIRMGHYKEGISITALREIKLLKEIKHRNVINLIDVYAGANNLNMVIEFCITDLEEVIRDRSILITPAEIKCCLKMILEGMVALHDKYILHRDLKPANILVGLDGQLKIADFGLARIHGSPERQLTHTVITRWYRPPELLYAAKLYGPAVDMWSVGCIFAELMLRMPYLPGSSDIEQLAKIFQARGTPTSEDWPDHECLPAFLKFSETPPPDHKLLFTASSPASLDLLDQFLQLNPKKRISAKDALEHRYFTEEHPPACDVSALLSKIRSGNTVKDDGLPSDNEN